MNPSTHAVLQEILLDPQQVVMTLLIMLIVPITAGMLLRATRPDTADKIRTGTRRIAGFVFAPIRRQRQRRIGLVQAKSGREIHRHAQRRRRGARPE